MKMRYINTCIILLLKSLVKNHMLLKTASTCNISILKYLWILIYQTAILPIDKGNLTAMYYAKHFKNIVSSSVYSFWQLVVNYLTNSQLFGHWPCTISRWCTNLNSEANSIYTFKWQDLHSMLTRHNFCIQATSYLSMDACVFNFI